MKQSPSLKWIASCHIIFFLLSSWANDVDECFFQWQLIELNIFYPLLLGLAGTIMSPRKPVHLLVLRTFVLRIP